MSLFGSNFVSSNLSEKKKGEKKLRSIMGNMLKDVEKERANVKQWFVLGKCLLLRRMWLPVYDWCNEEGGLEG